MRVGTEKRRSDSLLAATRSAIGLGNIWRLPCVTGTNGAAFIILYRACAVLICVPNLLAQLVLEGHAAQRLRRLGVGLSQSGRWAANRKLGERRVHLVCGFFLRWICPAFIVLELLGLLPAEARLLALLSGQPKSSQPPSIHSLGRRRSRAYFSRSASIWRA